jgi:hypothetical protein
VEAHERVRPRGRDLLDVHAPLRGEDEERLLRAPVERDRQVVLPRDLGCPLDPQLADDVTSDVQAENVRRPGRGLIRRFGELDPSGLAAPAGEDLRLDDDGAAQLGRCCACLLRARREHALGDRDPELPEQLFPLVLVEVQGAGESTRVREPILRCASIDG